MKAMLLILTILMFSLNGFAKVKTKKIKPQLKFTSEVYYRLSHKNRIKYLQAFIDLAVQMEKDKKRLNAQNDSLDLYNLLFPSAEATGRVCLAGGVFFEQPTGVSNCDREMTTLPDAVRTADAAGTPSLASFYTCGAEKRCASYFGVNSSGQGFCFSTFRNATTECQTASAAANGTQNLAGRLANCGANADFCRVFRNAMTRDQERMAAYCDAGRSAGACRRAREAVAALTSAGVTPAGTAPSPVLDPTSGCSERDLQAIQGRELGSSLERQLGFQRNADSMWMYLANIAQYACGGHRDPQEILRTVGVCEAPPAELPRCVSETQSLSSCINTEFRKGSITDFANRVNEITGSVLSRSNYCVLQEPGTQVWRCDDRSILELRNALQAGETSGRLGDIAQNMCPSQAQARTACMGRDVPQTNRSVDNPENVRLWVRDNRHFDADRAIDSLLAGRVPTDAAQSTDFANVFGMSPTEFKDMFCATSASDFYSKSVGLRNGPRGTNPVRDRMRACIQSNIRTVDDGQNDPYRRSNFGGRSCTMTPVTGVTRAQATEYLYYEQSTGLCRQGTAVVEAPSGRPPADGQVIVPCRSSDLVGSGAPAQIYVKLEHAVSGSSRPPVYACLDNIISGGASALQVSRFSCSLVQTSGDGPDTPAAQ